LRPWPRKSFPATPRRAREAGVIYFIDRALATFDRAKQGLYKKGLVDLQKRTAGLQSSTGTFSVLDAPRQIELLKNIEKTEFFEQVRLHTIMGFLANPEYGGNRDRIGWKLMALETASSTSRPSASTTATTIPKRTDRGRDGDENPEI